MKTIRPLLLAITCSIGVIALLLFVQNPASETWDAKPQPSTAEKQPSGKSDQPVEEEQQVSRPDKEEKTAPPAQPTAPASTTRDRFAELLDGAELLGIEDGEIRPDGSFIRRSLYRVDGFRYPKVLVEEVMNPNAEGEFESGRISAIVGDHAMIRLPEDGTEEELIGWTQANGFTIRDRLKTAPIYLVADESGAVLAVDGIIDSFRSRFLADQPSWDLRGIAEADHLGFFTRTPDDPDFDRLWGFSNDGSLPGSIEGADIDATDAWQKNTGTENVVVAIIDSGMQLDHEDLADNLWTNPGEIPGNGVDDDGNGFIDDVNGWDFAGDSWDPFLPEVPDNDPTDQNGHGTHVAGTVGAVGDNGTGVVGVNWEVSLMPLKIGSSSPFISFSAAIESTNYAVAEGADVMNNSYGGSSRPEDRTPPLLFEDAIRAANNAGVLFVAAAGNSASNNDSIPQYPASYTLQNVISVAASDTADELAFFSNFGTSSVDLAAPGSNILSTVPGNDYETFSGTSMASPMVAGAAALYKAVNRGARASAMRSRLLSTVDRIPSLSGKVATGGRLNLAKVVGGGAVGAGDGLSIANVSVTDDPAVSIHNNGDGVFNPGELLAISYTITNNSDEVAHVIYSDIEASPSEANGIRRGFDSMSFGNRSLGTLNPGQSVVDSNLRLYCYGNTANGTAGSYTISLEYGRPNARSSQSFNQDVFASNTVNVSGTVLTAPGDVPVAGGTVTLTGSVYTFQTTTDAQGRFFSRVPGDTYSVSVVYPGLGESDPLTINASNNVSGLKIEIDIPIASVSPTSVSTTVAAGDTATETLTLSNGGNADLDWILAGGELDKAVLPSLEPVFGYAYWLSADPVEGTVAPGEDATITLTFAPNDTESGTLESSVIFTTDDPANSEITVDVQMSVTPSTTSFPSSAYKRWLLAETVSYNNVDDLQYDADIDGDGLDNLVDFVMGDPDGNSGIRLEAADGRKLSLQMRDDVPVTFIRVIASDDLQTWTPIDPEDYTVVETDAGTNRKQVEIDLGQLEGTAFYRIEVIEP